MISVMSHHRESLKVKLFLITKMFSGRVQARDLDQEVVPDRKSRKNLRAEKQLSRTGLPKKLPHGSVLVEIDLEIKMYLL